MSRKGSFDRADILARTDLADLADELVGRSKGIGDGRRWASPTPGHEQTGKSPPMSIFVSRYGEERWTCFATGASGTAIDLVMTARSTNFRESIEWLANRAGVSEKPMSQIPATAPKRREPKPVVLRDPDPALEQWVDDCHAALMTPAAVEARSWLTDRGIPPEVQASNWIGYDPGEASLPRAPGLPKTAHAVIFPVRNEDGDVVYAQSRDLAVEADPKYRNPSSAFADNPNISFHEIGSDRVVVAEGIPDALMANAAGFSSVALLGSGNAMRVDVAERIGNFADGRPVVLALDADVSTEQVDHACDLLEQTCDKFSTVDLAEGDLSDLWKCSPTALNVELERAAREAGADTSSQMVWLRDGVSIDQLMVDPTLMAKSVVSPDEAKSLFSESLETEPTAIASRWPETFVDEM